MSSSRSRDPFAPARLGPLELRTRCTACNQCIAAMDAGGVRCVLDDPRW